MKELGALLTPQQKYKFNFKPLSFQIELYLLHGHLLCSSRRPGSPN